MFCASNFEFDLHPVLRRPNVRSSQRPLPLHKFLIKGFRPEQVTTSLVQSVRFNSGVLKLRFAVQEA
jgi:hypothetical protein